MGREKIIRTIYLYLFSLIGLVLITNGSVRLVELTLKTFIFTKADQTLIYPVYPQPMPVPPSSEGVEGVKEISPEEEKKYQEEQRKYDEESRRSQQERTAAEALAMIIVGLPLFLYHWRIIQTQQNV